MNTKELKVMINKTKAHEKKAAALRDSIREQISELESFFDGVDGAADSLRDAVWQLEHAADILSQRV